MRVLIGNRIEHIPCGIVHVRMLCALQHTRPQRRSNQGTKMRKEVHTDTRTITIAITTAERNQTKITKVTQRNQGNRLHRSGLLVEQPLHLL